MAIEFVGQATATGTDATHSCSLTSLSGGIDTAAAAGDLVIVGHQRAGVSIGDVAVGVSTSGYTEEVNTYIADSRGTNFAVAHKFMGGSPDTAVDVVDSGGGTGSGSAIVVRVYRGVDSGTPLDVAIQSATAANDGVPNPPSITPTTSGAFVVIFGASSSNGGIGSVTHPSGYGNGVAVNSVSCIGVSADKAWTSGAEDPDVWGGITTGGTFSWAAATLALRPGSGASIAPVAAFNYMMMRNN